MLVTGWLQEGYRKVTGAALRVTQRQRFNMFIFEMGYRDLENTINVHIAFFEPKTN